MSQFSPDGQNIGVSASASILPMNILDRFPLRLTGWISLQFKGLSTVFFSTIFQKHQFFGAQPLSRRRQWHPTPVLLPGESQGQGSLVGCRLWGRTELDTTEVI